MYFVLATLTVTVTMWSLLLSNMMCQIYEVPCSVQTSDEYKWGTKTGLMAGTLTTSIVPFFYLTEPTSSAVSTIATAVLEYLWPLIIGENGNCVAEALATAATNMAKLTDQKVDNLTLEEVKQWFDGHIDTAKKIYDWVPIIRDAADEMTRRQASLEFLKDLKYLYYSANEARDSFIEASIGQPSSFLFIRELAFLQLGVASEIANNKYTPPIAKEKFLIDYQRDVEFYWRAGHLAVEKLVRCLPKEKIGKARSALSLHLYPLYDFAYKFFNKNNKSAHYTRNAVYKPVVNSDYVAFRLDNGKLARFEHIYRQPPREDSEDESCPQCGWDLFDDRFSPDSIDRGRSWGCRSAVFDIISKTSPELGSPIKSCDTVVINYRPPAEKLLESSTPEIKSVRDAIETPIFTIASFNQTTNLPLPCGNFILDRDRVLLTPAWLWKDKVDRIDVIIIKAN